MAPRVKRKAAASAEDDDPTSKRRFVETDTTSNDQADEEADTPGKEISGTDEEVAVEAKEQDEENQPVVNDKISAMKARFEALKARSRQGQKDNAKEVKREQDRIKADPAFLKKLERQNAIAAQKLTKADMEAAGDDYERKRAWDWTIDESEKWDRHMEGKLGNYNRNKFTDYTMEAEKVYDRQTNGIKADRELYERLEMEKIQRAIDNGELLLAETADGEIVAIDKSGTFGTNTQYDFSHKPTQEAINALAEDVAKAKEVRLKNRTRRHNAIQSEDGDVTYINSKNQMFNTKLGRFFDKYTTELRDSFERGSAT